MSTGQVNEPTVVQLNLINSIALPAGSIITIDLPKMNLEAPRSLRKSYVVDPDNMVCKAIQNIEASIKCKYEVIDNEMDRLTITDILQNGQSAGSQLVIEIDSFFNPFSMTKRLFFTTISTVSEFDGKIYSVQEGYTSF
jgi:hypothetical protein